MMVIITNYHLNLCRYTGGDIDNSYYCTIDSGYVEVHCYWF